jgi:hypothetical protein
MLDSLILATLIGANAGLPPCAATYPVITSVAVQNVMPDAGVNQYTIRVSVMNRGQNSQASNALQSVQIYQDATKVGEKGIPPLKAGGTYAFPYRFTRNSDAADGTTNLVFRLDRQAPGEQDCGMRYALSV